MKPMPRPSLSLVLLLVGFSSAFSAARAAGDDEGIASRQSLAPLQTLTTSDAKAVRNALRAMDFQDFTGVLEFEFELVGRNAAQQRGRLFVGPSGWRRLDVRWQAEDEHEWACCVREHDAWLVVSGSPLVKRATNVDAISSAGWGGQLRAQAQQARCWSDVLVHDLVPDAASRMVDQVSQTEGKVLLRLSPSPVQRFQGPLDITLTRAAGDILLPSEVSFPESAAVLDLVGYEAQDGRRQRPEEYTLSLPVADGSISNNTWRISGRSRRSLDEDEFIEQFEPPTTLSDKRFSQLVGEAWYDAAGDETIIMWRQ